MMKLITILMALATSLVATTGVAAADQRAVYTIKDVPVDVRADNARAAEEEAFSEAKIIALRRLVNKLTLPEDRSKATGLSFSGSTANFLAAAVDVVEEKRSANVYRGTLSVVFSPTRVRQYLEAANLPYVDQQASVTLLAPVSSDSGLVDVWREVWPDADSGALAPYVKALALYGGGSDWEALSDEAAAVGARSAVLAVLIGDPGAHRVRLLRVTPNGQSTIGVTRALPTLEEAAEASVSYLSAIQKQNSVVRSTRRTRTVATVLYGDIQEWNQMRTALARSALVQDFRVDAIARDGAMVTFEFAGDLTRLTGELRQRGVALETDRGGWVLRSAYGAAQ